MHPDHFRELCGLIGRLDDLHDDFRRLADKVLNHPDEPVGGELGQSAFTPILPLMPSPSDLPGQLGALKAEIGGAAHALATLREKSLRLHPDDPRVVQVRAAFEAMSFMAKQWIAFIEPPVQKMPVPSTN
jgi:hypothetical protein